ncbi:MAG: hypothetical protein MUE60_12730 [Candidatus Eisenbacteria bacterium]|nr:hypothetical protein [Candidatus Eisenbacteria bacterium]
MKFVKLMCVLGSYFDEDPLYPWAAHILADDTLPSPFIRLHNLYRTAAGFLEQTAGANGEHYRRALVRVRSMPYEELVRGRSDDEGAGIQALLYEVYPEHYRTLAQDTFQALESLARSKVQAHGLESREGLLTYILLMFMVGSHFDRDPLHPWVSPVLALQADPRSKSLQLYAAAMDRLDVYKIVDR